MTMKANFITGTEALASWREDVLHGGRPVVYPVGPPEWSNVEVAPGQIMLVGGAPASGKTALTMQLVFEALARTPELRVIVGNVEMPPAALFDRQLARFTGYSATDIRLRQRDRLNPEALARGVDRIATLSKNLAYLTAPFSLENMAMSADAFQADLLVLDYLQRYAPPGDHAMLRGAINSVMSCLRAFADRDKAIIAVSAISRGRNDRGSTYDRSSLGLASYRESSELEYGCDTAWILAPDDNGLHFTCVKNRFGEASDLLLNFDKPTQSFVIAPESLPEKPADTARNKLRRLTRKELHRRAQQTRSIENAADDPDEEF